MIVLTIRTDKPEAEIGFFDDHKQLAYQSWQAHRELAETLHSQIAKNLQSLEMDWRNLEGIVAYEGPGSFTGLRIGLSLANALAYGLQVPIVGATGDDWIATGRKHLLAGENDRSTLPQYGAAVYITVP